MGNVIGTAALEQARTRKTADKFLDILTQAGINAAVVEEKKENGEKEMSLRLASAVDEWKFHEFMEHIYDAMIIQASGFVSVPEDRDAFIRDKLESIGFTASKEHKKHTNTYRVSGYDGMFRNLEKALDEIDSITEGEAVYKIKWEDGKTASKGVFDSRLGDE